MVLKQILLFSKIFSSKHYIDLDDIGAQDIPHYLLSKVPYGKITYDEGVMFATYSSLISSSRDKKTSRLQQLIKWVGGHDFNGCILLDECHKAKNLVATGSQQKGTK